MNSFRRFIEIIDANLIQCLIPIVLTLFLAELLFSRRFQTKKVLRLVCFSIIFYTILTSIYFVTGLLLYPEKFAVMERATGPYGWAYWLMSLSALLLPYTLFFKKMASKFFYVLWVAVFMKIGFYFERFVIIVTSFHRDYQLESANEGFTDSILFGLLLISIQGILIGIIALIAFEFFKKKNKNIDLVNNF